MPCLYELNDKCINQIFKILDVLFFRTTDCAQCTFSSKRILI